MVHIHNLRDIDPLIDSPALYREVTSYLLCYQRELLEYEEEENLGDHDFNFKTWKNHTCLC